MGARLRSLQTAARRLLAAKFPSGIAWNRSLAAAEQQRMRTGMSAPACRHMQPVLITSAAHAASAELDRTLTAIGSIGGGSSRRSMVLFGIWPTHSCAAQAASAVATAVPELQAQLADCFYTAQFFVGAPWQEAVRGSPCSAAFEPAWGLSNLCGLQLWGFTCRRFSAFCNLCFDFAGYGSWHSIICAAPHFRSTFARRFVCGGSTSIISYVDERLPQLWPQVFRIFLGFSTFCTAMDGWHGRGNPVLPASHSLRGFGSLLLAAQQHGLQIEQLRSDMCSDSSGDQQSAAPAWLKSIARIGCAQQSSF